MPLLRYCRAMNRTRWGHPASRQGRSGWHFLNPTGKEAQPMNLTVWLELAILILRILAAGSAG